MDSAAASSIAQEAELREMRERCVRAEGQMHEYKSRMEKLRSELQRVEDQSNDVNELRGKLAATEAKLLKAERHMQAAQSFVPSFSLPLSFFLGLVFSLLFSSVLRFVLFCPVLCAMCTHARCSLLSALAVPRFVLVLLMDVWLCLCVHPVDFTTRSGRLESDIDFLETQRAKLTEELNKVKVERQILEDGNREVSQVRAVVLFLP